MREIALGIRIVNRIQSKSSHYHTSHPLRTHLNPPLGLFMPLGYFDQMLEVAALSEVYLYLALREEGSGYSD